MSTSAKAVRFEDARLVVDLADGRILSVPLAWFPRLLAATHEQLQQVRISRRGLHWVELDEDISVVSLLAAYGGQSVSTLPSCAPDLCTYQALDKLESR